jgi:hypothetical protein
MVGPWRTTPAFLSAGYSSALKGHIFPSGRQALVEVLKHIGLTRADRVAMPEWSSACVLGAVSAVATPVPLREVKASGQPPAAVLVYDQWGWARRGGALDAIAGKWPEAVIVYDTVDTADLDIAITQPSFAADVPYHARVWSLSKILGLSGGGFAQYGTSPLPFTPDPAHRTLCEMLEGLLESRAAATDIAKSHVRYLPLKLQETIMEADLWGAFANERALRLRNLEAMHRTGLTTGWPTWMTDQGADGGPGLCPILRGASTQGLEVFRKHMLSELGIELPTYRFDFAGDPVEPSYELCLAFPLHGEITPGTIAEVWELGRKLDCS